MPAQTAIITAIGVRTNTVYPIAVDYQGGLDSANWKIMIQWDAAGNPIYVGEAPPGLGTGTSYWRIKRITWVAGNPTAVEWANGSADFIHEWDDRALYAYS